MLQQILALIVILFFLGRLFRQKSKKQISSNEFVFWFLVFSSIGIAIIGLKYIDIFVASLGFSASGIEVLLYISVVMLLYFVFKIRMRQEIIDKSITKIVREIALNNNNNNNNES